MAEIAALSGVASERIEALEAGALDPDLDMLLALSESVSLRFTDLALRAEALAKEVKNA